jgi:alpha-L-fucosidase
MHLFSLPLSANKLMFMCKLFTKLLCVLCALVSIFRLNAQELSYKNYACIEPGTSSKEIVEIAANLSPSPRQFSWQQMELTAFIHFGINTFTDREWGDGTENPQLFNPTQLDAEQWVLTCKNAGFKLIILTAKHHDGFCLWPSNYTEHSVKNSPWKNGQGDVVKEVADACRKYDVKFGVYLSPWDRNSAYYGTDEYNDYFVNQLTELLTNYGTISEVWFDGANGEGPNGKTQEYDNARWNAVIRNLQPDAVISIAGPDVRWVGTETGYGSETEWSVVVGKIKNREDLINLPPEEVAWIFDVYPSPGTRPAIAKAEYLLWYPAETDVSIRPGWFYHTTQDTSVKTPDKLFDIYCSSVGRNGVLLLNMPPDTRGLIHEKDVETLEGFASIITKTFANNLLVDACISCSNGDKLAALTDHDYDTYWITNGQDTTSVIEFDFEEDILFDLFVLQENIKKGQRIETFKLEYNDGNSWKEITSGTTVGYKRILRFDPLWAKQIRLRIESSRSNPTLSEIGLYKQADFTTGIEEMANRFSNSSAVFLSNNTLYVTTEQAGTLYVYDISGRLCILKQLSVGTTEFPLMKGFYIVTLNKLKWKILN